MDVLRSCADLEMWKAALWRTEARDSLNAILGCDIGTHPERRPKTQNESYRLNTDHRWTAME